MPFTVIRVLLLLLLSVFIIIGIRSSRIVKKKSFAILAFVLCMVLLSASVVFPVENLFINFKTPESVFDYANSGKIYEILYGKNSCIAIFSKNDGTVSHYIIPKTENGFKIPGIFITEKVSHKFDKSALFDVYNVKGTKDYYVFGFVHLKDSQNKIEVFDGKKPEKIESSIVRVKNTNFIYFYLDDFSAEHYLLINDEKVSISK